MPNPECRSCGSELPDDTDMLCAECSYEMAEPISEGSRPDA